MNNIKFNKVGAVLGLVWGLIIVGAVSVAFAATAVYTAQSGDTWEKIAASNSISVQQLVDLNQPVAGQKINVPGAVVVPPVTPPTPAPGEIIHLNVYTTGYGYPDNTPRNSAAIADPVLHSTAGGTGTFADPITVAVGHTIVAGKDTLDFPAGTKFYVPNLRRYFIVEDACGDGKSPQNVPCHNLSTAPKGTTLWIDLWVGGVGQTAKGTIACEEAITPLDNGSNLRTVIQNPVATYPVVAGQIYNGTCSQQFGN